MSRHTYDAGEECVLYESESWGVTYVQIMKVHLIKL